MNLRILPLCFLLLTFLHTSLAQKKWEGGVSVGLANYIGDLVDTPFPRPEESQLTYGLHVRRRLSPNTGLRLHYLRGTLASDDFNSNDPAFRERGFTFNALLTEVALGLDYELRGHKRFNREGRIVRNIWTPYGFVQGGLSTVRPETGYGTGDFPPEMKDRIRADREADFATTRLALGAGLGLRFDLDKRTTLSLETGLRTSFSDYLDGISQAANADDFDWYTFTGVHLSIDIGPPDFDADGVPDRKDECPQTRGPAELNGCPDSDGDGIANIHDPCPRQPGLPEHRGCPDTDGDGFADPDDHCPDLPGTRLLFGCPDRDGDEVADPDDRCPDTPGPHDLAGCPDTDGDGLSDADDACPEKAGPEANGGCPMDRDGDGLPDGEDLCPDAAGPARLDGCPDTDGDGIADNADACPDRPGPASNRGCPELQAHEEDTLTRAIRAIRFRTGSAELLPESYPILDQVAEVLRRHPEYRVVVHGFTDNTGSAAVNQRLSEARAQTCVRYLVGKGIAPERLEAKGWGKRYPVATNATVAGRRLNRRVEFELLLPGMESKYR
ncbi:MAG: OmpA family protein [Bacteroidetes bacterium]|nr:MAG: OmpA family protein [Bacteroidota bacterium]